MRATAHVRSARLRMPQWTDRAMGRRPARWLRDAYQRSAAIQRVLDQAAVSTPEAARVQHLMENRRHDEFANACRLVLGGRLPPSTLVDEIWALGSRGMWFMLADRGWSPEQWEAWFVRVILDAVGEHNPPPGTAGATRALTLPLGTVASTGLARQHGPRKAQFSGNTLTSGLVMPESFSQGASDQRFYGGSL
jgi:hypothetical protein